MEGCDGPVSAMTIGEAARCFWEKGSSAVTAVMHNPGAGTITDWAIAFLALVLAINLLSLIVRILVPPLR